VNNKFFIKTKENLRA